jgi:hypothetical protein
MARRGPVAFGHLSVLGTWTKRIGPKRVGDKTYLQTKHISGHSVMTDKRYQKTPSQSVSSADRMYLGRQKWYRHQLQHVSRNRIVNGGRTLTVLQRTVSRGVDGLKAVWLDWWILYKKINWRRPILIW